MKSQILPRRSNFGAPGAIIFILLISTFIFIAIPISVGTAADETPSPSFSCQRDNLTQVEKIICSDPELAALDAEMSKLFEAKKKSISEKERQSFFDDQRRWLKQRDSSCNIKNNAQVIGQVTEEKKTCLKNLYQGRINALKTSDSDEWGAALNELAHRIQPAYNEQGLDTSNLFSKPSDIQTANGESEKFGTCEEVIKSIKKHYILTESQIAEISEFAEYANGVSLYLEDVDQDGIKDVIIKITGGSMSCKLYRYYHVNRDRTLTRMEGPDPSRFDSEGGICDDNPLGFVQLNNKTYIAAVDNYLHDTAALQPKTIIELFSLKSERGRKGIGKIQVNYRSQFEGKLVKGDNPAFHVLEEKADALARHFAQAGSPPLATSLMNNPAWTYKGKEIEKIFELIGKEYYTDNFLKNESRYQLLDIDNDGEKEIVCHLVYKVKDTKDTKYSRMIIVKMGTSGPISYIDVDKYYPKLAYIDDKFLKYYCCNGFRKLDYKGSEYFPLSDGKENYIVKIGGGWGRNDESLGYILGIYKLKAGKIELVDAMSIDPEFTFKDVTVLK